MFEMIDLFLLLLSVIIAQSVHYQTINTFTSLGQEISLDNVAGFENEKKKGRFVFTTDNLNGHQQISLIPTSCHSPLH